MGIIDLYISKIGNKSGGNQRTLAYPFVEDGVILVKKCDDDFLEKKAIIEKCKKMGVNVPLYIDYKYDGQNYWILEELAPGKELEQIICNENIIDILEKYVSDSYILWYNGLGLETRPRNVFYDKEKGFTNIDVGLLPNIPNPDSLYEVNCFFRTVFPVLVNYNYPKNSYGEVVKEQVMSNAIKAFENVHPFFKKYRRWIYRTEEEYCRFIETQGEDLTLSDEEHKELLYYIESYIDLLIDNSIKNQSICIVLNDIFFILEAAIKYCPKFSLFNLEEKTLAQYVSESFSNKLKSKFSLDTDNPILRELYIQDRTITLFRNLIPYDEIDAIIEEEINAIVNNKKI